MTDETEVQIIMRSYRGEEQSATAFGAALEYLSTKGISRYKDAVIWAKQKQKEQAVE